MSNNDKPEHEKKKPSLWQVAHSVLAALIGIQTSKNYQRDFQHGEAWQYIVLGLIAVAIFIGSIILVVSLVLP